MERATLCERLDDRLRTEAYADGDASPNGLQVGRLDRDVEHVAFAVDAAVATVDAAVDAGADLLVTHHGVVWGGLERLTGPAYDRVAPLVDHDVGLYVSHLPLDGHPAFGNAAGVADHLGLATGPDDREPFADVAGEPIGVRGRAAEPMTADEVEARLAELDNDGVRTFEFGPDRIEDVAVVTGSGADFFGAARDAGVDAFVTGEGKQQLYHEAREAGISVFLAGHYATETFGVRNLQALCDDWGLETSFISHPTGL